MKRRIANKNAPLWHICTTVGIQAAKPSRTLPAAEKPVTGSKRPGVRAFILLVALFAPLSTPLAAEEPAGYAGIWEAVNYPADLELNDVFFVTPDVGWVTGGLYGNQGGGVILATRDGGASWDVQVGDPQSTEPRFEHLYFLDENHGWALQPSNFKYKLLRTSDGETWEEAGWIEHSWGMMGYQFFSPSTGVYLDGNNNVSRIMRTIDGGRTWNEVWRCRSTVQVQGLSRQVDCPLEAMHFPTSEVGYAVAESHGFLFVGKTQDGGQTWRVSTVPHIAGNGGFGVPTVFFTDENTGFVGLEGNKLYRTDDGGETWKGLIGKAGAAIRFADPGVGWSMVGYKTLAYTTDGGRKWSSRELSLPAKSYAFSLPRRDRGYLVGEHGMIYRYSVVASASAPANVMTGPIMPAFTSPLTGFADQLALQVDALRLQVAEGTSGGFDSVEYNESGEGELNEEYSFASECCAEPMEELWTTFEATAVAVPDFLSNFRNLNQIFVALRWASVLPHRLGEIRETVQSFNEAPDAAAATEALDRMEVAVQEFIAATRQAFQQDVPAPGSYTDFAPGAGVAVFGGGEAEEIAPGEVQQRGSLFDAVKKRIKKEVDLR